MALSLKQRNRFIEGNKLEYGALYDQLFFPDEKTLLEADKRRRDLLKDLAESVAIGCLGTKLDVTNLSPGCQACVEGQWSCLFINGKCNGNCFYCPTSQDEVGLPTTNTLSFQNPDEYVSYLRIFGFRGASISGGEPLLTLEKSVQFIQSIKRAFGETIHIWLYTNGLLATRDIMKRLADAGLDEIRFDIGATGYSIRPLDHAVGIIPTVTVEIPAVPEECERMKILLPTLYDSGVQHLNLHQLRLTPHNFKKLVSRGYKFLHGKKITVLDSELTALDILRHRKINNINLPINYCSFPYKDRFQSHASRRRNGSYIQKGHESLTENGFIRTLVITANQEALAQHLSTLKKDGFSENLWQQKSSQELYIHIDLLRHLDSRNLSLNVSYSAANQRPTVSYRNPFTKVEITSKMEIVVERETYPHRFTLSPEQTYSFLTITASDNHKSSQELEKINLPEEIFDFERIRSGLNEYY